VAKQTHAPNVTAYIWAGHGDTTAMHSQASVFLVRQSDIAAAIAASH